MQRIPAAVWCLSYQNLPPPSPCEIISVNNTKRYIYPLQSKPWDFAIRRLHARYTELGYLPEKDSPCSSSHIWLHTRMSYRVPKPMKSSVSNDASRIPETITKIQFISIPIWQETSPWPRSLAIRSVFQRVGKSVFPTRKYPLSSDSFPWLRFPLYTFTGAGFGPAIEQNRCQSYQLSVKIRKLLLLQPHSSFHSFQ